MGREGRKDGVSEEGRPKSRKRKGAGSLGCVRRGDHKAGRKRERGLWGPMGHCCHGDSRVNELKRRKLLQNWDAQNKG